MGYKVTAPAASIRFIDPETGKLAVTTLYFEAKVPDNIEPAHLEHLINLEFVKSDEPEAAPEVDDPDGPGGAPAKSATKDEWVAFATAQGDNDAASKTKEQLIAEHYPAS